MRISQKEIANLKSLENTVTIECERTIYRLRRPKAMKIILISLIFVIVIIVNNRWNNKNHKLLECYERLLTQKLGKRCYRKTQKSGNGWMAKERQRQDENGGKIRLE